MVDTASAEALRQRWHKFFSQILRGESDVFDRAADAAIAAIQRGADQEQAIAAGIRAARGDGSDRTASTGRSTRTPPAQNGANSTTTRQGSANAQERVWPASSAVVYSIERRSESLDGTFFQVLSCRLLRLEGGRRPVQPPIPVEIRGRVIIGQVKEGDVVAIPHGREGHTRIVKTLRNLSTDSVIEAKGRPFRRTRTVARTSRLVLSITVKFVALAILVAIALLGYWLLTGSEIQMPFDIPGW